MYFFGIGVEQNHLNALNWFNSLSEMNDASLHLHIGYLHYKGSGIKKDLEKAFDSLSRAVDLGSEGAHLALLDLNFQENLEMDLKKSVKNVENKIKTDPLFGFNNMKALTYLSNIPPFLDLEERFTYFSKIPPFLELGSNNFREIYDEFIGLNLQSKTERTQKIIDTIKQQAAAGNAEGHYQLIRKFFDDEIELDVKKGIELNVSSSIDWLKQSGEKGDVIAQRIIAEMYQNGLGVDKSPRTAYEWYLKAAKNECPKSQCELGHLYLNNQFTPRYHNNLSTNKTLNEENLVNPDIKKSIHWLLKAGKQGEYNAVDKLIELFEQKKLKGDDLTIFLECLKKISLVVARKIYLKGIQVEQDYQKAYGFFSPFYPRLNIRLFR